jgi:6-phospho-3-hexuloisomerase
MRLKYKQILSEIELALEGSNFEKSNSIIKEIIQARSIITYGAGRVGLVMQGFSKRLMHLGLNSYYLEDSSVPSTTAGDLLIIGSGSGSTPTVKIVAELAIIHKLKLLSITANPDSAIANISNLFVYLNTPNKILNNQKAVSIQPLTTLFEQTLCIYLDALILELMEALNQTNELMKLRHNVIE